MKKRLLLFLILEALLFPHCFADENPALSSLEINSFNVETDRQFIDNTINTFIRKYDLPGLQIAISKNGKIIFAKGYGYADVKKKIPVSIINQFRIASVSKSITAVAIMKLMEEGKLSLSDKVFGAKGILSTIAYPASNHFVGEITIQHLLEHTAAREWTNDQHDPMFQETTLSKQQLVKWVLKTRQLTERPGSQYAYSNFGYCVLGLVIEKISGKSYKDYVIDTIFKPINTKSFAIADNKPGKLPLEARYYSDNVDPYGFPVKRMDSHGGWIANAIDLVKFSLSVDGLQEPKDILNADSIKLMSTPSKENNNYALGWNVNKYKNRWHMGWLPGSTSILVRTEQGYSWAVLTNKHSDSKNFMGDLDALTWNIINGVKQ